MLIIEDVSILRRIDPRTRERKGIVHRVDFDVFLEMYHDMKINKADLSKRTVVTTERYLDNHPYDEEVLNACIEGGMQLLVYIDDLDLVSHV